MPFTRARPRAFVLLALLAAACWAAAAAPARAMPGPDYFALNAQPMIKLGFITPDRWGPYLDTMTAGGIRVARVDAGWEFAEPNAPVDGQHTYLWDRPDAPTQSLDLLARTLAVRGIRMLPVIATEPKWARGGGSRVAPSRYPDLAAFAGAFAARYGSNGSFWQENPGIAPVPPRDYEIWTEANSANMWTGRSDPDAYMAAMPGIATAIRAADPGSRVLASVGWPNFENFVRDIYARGAKGVIDGIAFHPYAPHAPAIMALVQRLRTVLTQVGDTVPIEITETGQPVVTSGPGASRAGSGSVTDAARAATQSLTGDALARSDCNVGAFGVYTLVGSESKLEPIGEGFMGVVRLADAQPNATGSALFAAAQRWRARPRSGIVLCGQGSTAPADLLGLSLDLEHQKPTCATGTATYEGNPLEAAKLVLTVADGRTSSFEVDAHGKGEVCIPDGPPIWSFDVRAEVANVAASPTYRCPVLDGPCVIVARATDAPPTPQGAGCRWSLKTKVRGHRGARARLGTALSCTPKASRVPFRLAVRPRGAKRTTSLGRVTVTQGTTRTVTLKRRLRATDALVVTSTENTGTGVPGLQATGRTIGGATATGSEGCAWKLEARVIRHAAKRSKVRIRVACIPPGASTVRFVASLQRKGRTKATRLKAVTLRTGREQTVALRARVRRGDRITLEHAGSTKNGTPRISSTARVTR